MGDVNERDVSVIICVYTEDRIRDINAAIESIQKQTVRPRELIVVVDHNENLQNLVESDCADTGTFPVDLAVVSNSGIQGLSGARNTGVAVAVAPVVAFLDDDAVADPEWVGRISARMAAGSVVGVGGRVLPEWPADGQPEWFPSEFNWVVGCSYPGQAEGVQVIRNPIGANMAFRRDAVLTAGGFHTGIGRVGSVPLGCEETELAIRIGAGRQDAAVLFDPEAVVRHRVTPQRTTPRYFLRRCYAEGLSKALVSALVGSGSALDSERAYVKTVLPQGVWKRVRRIVTPVPSAGPTMSRREASSQIAMIVIGLIVTAFGYVVGRLRQVEAGPRAGGGMSDLPLSLIANRQ